MLTHNTPAAFTEHRRRVPFRPSQGNPIGDMLKANAAIHVADLARDERYIQKRNPEVAFLSLSARNRTTGLEEWDE
jgi:hypothetical protein